MSASHPHITDHALERSKERLGWGRSAASRMAAKAFADGLAHSDLRGGLKRYVDRLYLSERSANNIRIYGEHVYLFAGATLITVLQLPIELRRTANSLREDR